MENTVVPNPENTPMECIRLQLESCFHPTELEITDDYDKHIGHPHMGAGHYSVRIVAPEFSSLMPVQRHRMIYAALENLLRTDIHALSIKALAPGETR